MSPTPRMLRLLCCLGLFVCTLLLVPAPGTYVSAAGPAVLVKDINPGPQGSIGSQLFFAQNPGSVQGEFFFIVTDNNTAVGWLWRSDGSEAGTTPFGYFNNLESFINVNNTIFFGASFGLRGYELWKSDGTSNGTRVIVNPYGGPLSYTELLTNVNGTVYFRALDSASWGLWKTNGSSEDTALVKRYSQPITNLASSNGLLFYTSHEGVDGFSNALWRSDGTESGTSLLKVFDAVPPAYPGAPAGTSVWNLTDAGGLMFFMAYTSGRGFELWKSDGSSAGTSLVKENGPKGGFFKYINQTLFILADQGLGNASLWRSDGSAAGTIQLKVFEPGNSIVDVTPVNTMADVNGTLMFSLFKTTQTGSLWKSDGTTAGTVLVQDQLYHGSSSTVACGKLYFSAKSTEASANPQGWELWQSDGTITGTLQVQDIAPGAASSFPIALTTVGNRIFFGADDGTSGRELWMLPIEHTSGADPTPSIPLPHQLFLPHTQIDTSC